jgi:hypothetical protein
VAQPAHSLARGPAGKTGSSRARIRARPANGRPATPPRTPRAGARARAKATWARAAHSPPRLGQKRPGHALDDRSRTIKIDGYASISGKQNPSPFALPNPNPFPLPDPRRLRLPLPERASESNPASGGVQAGGATASPLAGVRVHRWVGAPPSSGFSVVPGEQPEGSSRELCPRGAQGLAGSRRRTVKTR